MFDIPMHGKVLDLIDEQNCVVVRSPVVCLSDARLQAVPARPDLAATTRADWVRPLDLKLQDVYVRVPTNLWGAHENLQLIEGSLPEDA